jgi:hypothetical protein
MNVARRCGCISYYSTIFTGSCVRAHITHKIKVGVAFTGPFNSFIHSSMAAVCIEFTTHVVAKPSSAKRNSLSEPSQYNVATGCYAVVGFCAWTRNKVNE